MRFNFRVTHLMAGRITLVPGISSVLWRSAVIPLISVAVSAISFARPVTVPVPISVSVPVSVVSVPISLPFVVAVSASIVVVVVRSTGFAVAWCHYFYLYVRCSGDLWNDAEFVALFYKSRHTNY